MNATEAPKRSPASSNATKSSKKSHRTYKRFSFHPFLKLQKVEKLDYDFPREDVDDSDDTLGSPLSSPTYSNWQSQDTISPKTKKSSDSRKLRFFKPAYFQSSTSTPTSQPTAAPPPLPPRIPQRFLPAQKYHMFSDLGVDFTPFRLVLFKVIGKNIWFRVIDAEEQTRLLHVHERLLEANQDNFLEESLEFEVFEDVEYVSVADVFLQTSPGREIFQLTSRKSQFLLEAMSSHSKREFVNRIKFELEAKLNPIVTDRMLNPDGLADGPGLLEKLYSLQHDGISPNNRARSFVDTTAEISTRCLKYGSYISNLQDIVQDKVKELDHALGKLDELAAKEKELQKLMDQWETLQKDNELLEQVEHSAEKLLSNTESSQIRLRKGEQTLGNNQAKLTSVQMMLNSLENTQDLGSTSIFLTGFGVLGCVLWVFLLYHFPMISFPS
ncbi:hypothetical protein K493DRAFT_320243, partial [Basidiobolus meristosporus CBS 931.73]